MFFKEKCGKIEYKKLADDVGDWQPQTTLGREWREGKEKERGRERKKGAG
jgi:hypothetical protein